MSEEPEVQETEEAPEPAKGKKSPKLIVIILLAIVLGGGGFFGMKIMGAKKAKPSAPKVGAVVQLEEFLVNLSDQKTFLKCQIALGFQEGFEFHGGAGGHAEGDTPPELIRLRDAIISVLTSKKPKDVATPAGKDKLKAELIAAINKVLGEHSEEEHASQAESDSPEPKETGKHADKTTDSPDQKSGEKAEPKGPVLEVYFTSFVTQEY